MPSLPLTGTDAPEDRMYIREQLSKYPYFRNAFASGGGSGVLDALTGLVSRRYMVGFIQDLVARGVPFTLALMDLDNFKFINDTYGHRIGDGVLAAVSGDLAEYLGDYGVAGRYGGDEFLIVNLRDLHYDEVKRFFAGMYTDFSVLRKNVDLGSCEPFVTGTIGSAAYPADAQDYAALFGLVDKALYRGKTKGRNCYIIYVEAKHRDITIRALAGRSRYAVFHDLAGRFDSQCALADKMKAMLDVLREDMRISDLYYAGSDGLMRSVGTGVALGTAQDLHRLVRDDVHTTNEIRHMETVAPRMHALCRACAFESVMIVRIGIQAETFGYLICAEPRTLRIWQDDELAIMFFAARMLAVHMRASGEKI